MSNPKINKRRSTQGPCRSVSVQETLGFEYRHCRGGPLLSTLTTDEGRYNKTEIVNGQRPEQLPDTIPDTL